MTAPALQTMLLATDGSPDAALAARAASDLCRQTGATLHVVHAWQVPTLAGQAEGQAYPDATVTGHSAVYETYAQRAERLLAEQLAALYEAGVGTVREHLVNGHPVAAIVDLAAVVQADLIVLGSRGLGPVGRLVLGSVSEGVAHHATRPVLVLRGGADAWPPRRLVIGADGSADADRAATLAARIGHLYGATATLVHAFPELPLLPFETLAEGRARRDEAMQRAEEALAGRVQRVGALLGRRPDVSVVVADPAHLLLSEAEQAGGPALLAVGSRGLGPLQRFWLGSTSTKVLRAAHGPVLIAPHRAQPVAAGERDAEPAGRPVSG
ncbi:MAG TPA: universal stress protein [Thermomicrobiales bacterium]|nr:universal stress protein [Thermomicrobiales bacterium]